MICHTVLRIFPYIIYDTDIISKSGRIDADNIPLGVLIKTLDSVRDVFELFVVMNFSFPKMILHRIKVHKQTVVDSYQ